eukprot:TRINITY_DN85_c0_g1_i5.p1 TRINITY_DN85_c0_g1~~TRINITY_DN85_c0_g1_i5.p1  ORF type:complete len:455 (-),score=70.27 TRINITY_DN85_c0_g1_i5:32-1396(-)
MQHSMTADKASKAAVRVLGLVAACAHGAVSSKSACSSAGSMFLQLDQSVPAPLALTSMGEASSTTCRAIWTQCGGKTWSGPTCCEQSLMCKVTNEWYHQCVPASQPSPTPSSTVATTRSTTTQQSTTGLTASTSSSTPASTSEASSTTCGATWAQCGGKTWAGPNCCEQSLMCKVTNEWYHQCVPASQPSPTPSSTVATTRSTTTQQSTAAPSPSTSTNAPSGGWDGENMVMTHYWDCSGQGCDATVLQPWDGSKYVSPPGYGPQDPKDHGGAAYGEMMWLTGAASDVLSALMGPDDGCCGAMDDGAGGCGKCLLVENADSVHPEWTAVVMKKSRCPPWAEGCGANEPHFDVAAPGFDNLQWSLANICGQPGTGFDNQSQSESVGNWWTECSNTAACSYLCDKLPEHFQAGCKLFASWGWKRGNPSSVKFNAVPCPSAFAEHVSKQFGPAGVTA